MKFILLLLGYENDSILLHLKYILFRARYLSHTRKSLHFNARADIPSGVRSLKFGLILYIHLCSVRNASSEGFGSPGPSSLGNTISMPHLCIVKPV